MQTNRKSLFIFFALVFALSIPFWILGMINPIQLLPGLPISAFVAFIPAMAALILIYRNDGLSGALQMMQRSFDFKRIKNRNWYLAVILINPAIAVLAYGFMRAVGEALPDLTTLTPATLPMFMLFFIAGLGEEIGWSGYATEPLQSRYGTFIAGIFLGSVWAIFHYIPLMQAHRPVEWIAWWSLNTISLRIIIVWLYIYCGRSIFAAAMFHAISNLCWQLFPNHGSHFDPRVFALITLCFAVAAFYSQKFLAKGNIHAVYEKASN